MSMNLPRLTATQVQLRHALIELALYSQFDSTFMNTADEKARVYYTFSPNLESDSPHFTDENTSLTELERYAVFQRAVTL